MKNGICLFPMRSAKREPRRHLVHHSWCSCFYIYARNGVGPVSAQDAKAKVQPHAPVQNTLSYVDWVRPVFQLHRHGLEKPSNGFCSNHGGWCARCSHRCCGSCGRCCCLPSGLCVVILCPVARAEAGSESERGREGAGSGKREGGQRKGRNARGGGHPSRRWSCHGQAEITGDRGGAVRSEKKAGSRGWVRKKANLGRRGGGIAPQPGRSRCCAGRTHRPRQAF